MSAEHLLAAKRIALIDAHCHLEEYERAGEIDEVMERAASVGVRRMIAIGTSPVDWEANQKLAQRHPERIAFTVGWHPCQGQGGGEYGLAFSVYKKSVSRSGRAWGDRARLFFTYHRGQKPPRASKPVSRPYFVLNSSLHVILGCRWWFIVARQSMTVLRLSMPQGSIGVRSSSIVLRKVRRRYNYSMNGEEGAPLRGSLLTKKQKPCVRLLSCRDWTKSWSRPIHPYLAPEPKRGKRNEPAFVWHTAQFCAQLFELSLESFAERATANTEAFFNLEQG